MLQSLVSEAGWQDHTYMVWGFTSRKCWGQRRYNHHWPVRLRRGNDSLDAYFEGVLAKALGMCVCAHVLVFDIHAFLMLLNCFHKLPVIVQEHVFSILRLNACVLLRHCCFWIMRKTSLAIKSSFLPIYNCRYIHTYIYIYTYIHTYTYMYIYIYIYIYIHAWMCVCVTVPKTLLAKLLIHAHTHTHTHTHDWMFASYRSRPLHPLR
jgi:hypothetical protein